MPAFTRFLLRLFGLATVVGGCALAAWAASSINEKPSGLAAGKGLIFGVVLTVCGFALMFKKEGLDIDDPELWAPQLTPEKLAEIQKLAANGSIIEAVKSLRDATGAGVIEAKDYVDRLRHAA